MQADNSEYTILMNTIPKNTSNTTTHCCAVKYNNPIYNLLSQKMLPTDCFCTLVVINKLKFLKRKKKQRKERERGSDL